MGYTTNDIAAITEPRRFTLVSQPNFIQFKSKTPLTQVPLHYTVDLKMVTGIPLVRSELRVTETATGTVHIFKGDTNPANTGGSVYHVTLNAATNAENLRQALLNDAWISANFNVTIPFIWAGATASNGTIISIISKGAGPNYNAIFTAPNDVSNSAYVITEVSFSSNNDSISNTTAEIELDIYADSTVFLGQDDRPVSPATLGAFVIPVQKTYLGAPLWFELNSIFQHFAGYTVPPDLAGWFDTGTVRAYRFLAKRKGVDNLTFYISNTLYVLNGYGPASEALDLTPYTYGNDTIKLLTNKPRTTYVRGQRAFINFLFSDPMRGIAGTPVFNLRVAYKVYSTSNTYLGTEYKHVKSRTDFAMVNTCVLEIDTVLDAYPKAGFIRVGIVRDSAVVSEEIEYEIRPDCLHDLTQFTFLNRLGGWDAFNFDAIPDDEIKPNIETFNKTVTPAYTKATGIETIYTTNLEHTITVEGAPVTNEVADWLKELAAARVVLDGNGNYVIIEDLKVKISEANNDMQVPTIKYHLSETYTND